MDTMTLDVKALGALAHPTRLRMIAAIGPGGISGDRLKAQFPDLPKDMFSWHLQALRRTDLVRRVRAATGDRRLYLYRLNLGAFAALAARVGEPDLHYLPTDTSASHA